LAREAGLIEGFRQMSPYTNQVVERNSVVDPAGSAENNTARWARRISREKLISLEHAFAFAAGKQRCEGSHHWLTWRLFPLWSLKMSATARADRCPRSQIFQTDIWPSPAGYSAFMGTVSKWKKRHVPRQQK
jgi:hypothetical protein